MNNLKIINWKERKKNFFLEVPNKLKYRCTPTKVAFRLTRELDYVYVPRKYTFASRIFLTVEELKVIIKKLEELNKGKK